MFRARCLKNCILHLARGYNRETIDKSPSNDINSGLPKWVKTIVPKTSIIDSVKEIEEEVGPCIEVLRRKRDIVKGVEINSDDDSLYVLHHIYTTVVNSLNKNRKQVRRIFTRHIGFLLINWNDIGFTKMEQNTEIIWARPYENTKFTLPSTIKENKTVVQVEGEPELENEKLLYEFICQQEEMVVYITHPVLCWPKKTKHVRKQLSSGNTAVNIIPTKKMIRKKISLIELALLMLREMTGFEEKKSLSEMLKFNKKTLAAAYFLATCLQIIINGHKSKTKVRHLSADELEINASKSADDDTTEGKEKKYLNIKIEKESAEIIESLKSVLLCGNGETIRFLETVLLKQSIDSFNKNHVPFTNEIGSLNEAIPSTNPHGYHDDSTKNSISESKVQEDFEADL